MTKKSIKNSKSKFSHIKNSSRRETVAHYVGILMEEMQSQFKFVVEHVSGMNDNLIKRMDEKFDKVDARLANLETVVTKHSSQLEQIEHRLENVEHRLENVEHRLENVEHRLENVENRLEKVETTVEINGVKLDAHQALIKSMMEMLMRHDKILQGIVPLN